MRSDTLRDLYLDFFREKDHLILPSASLVPRDDPTLLLIGAGMAPFKPYFTGQAKPPHPRIATCQKCLRTADIDRVGKTARHCTFFEMLGNFSFGDYFKSEAIAWAWEFVTERLKLPREKLWVTIYHDDDEAFAIWNREIGVPAEKIRRMGKEDNFWEIGPGPCGPCSEIYFDRGPAYGCGRDDCTVGCECDRFLEFWNLVFTQFDRDEHGNYHALAKKNIDTGLGLERAAVILQGVANVFEIDIVKPVVEEVCRLARIRYGADERADVAVRVITEHLRGVVFLVAEGILPGNEGRGYVLRRLLRRAARYGKLLGLEKPFLYALADTVVDLMRGGYPELVDKAKVVSRVIRLEEERFSETLELGTQMLRRIIESAKAAGSNRISGEAVFRLYDTYGFPVELTEEIAAESGLGVDRAAFEQEMEVQRERARTARREPGWVGLDAGLPEGLRTRFVGYDTTRADASVIAILREGEPVGQAGPGEQVGVVLDITPFYGEAGGQVGDTGTLRARGMQARVTDAGRSPEGATVHAVEITRGTLTTGDVVTASVDVARRKAIARNHTATHLLHRALRDVLGAHVRQEGSLVDADRLRFDFAHFCPLSQGELREVETIVNSRILENIEVKAAIVPYDQALACGAIALFGEKYEDKVRVVSVGKFSRELCGGTHVRRTGEIGLFKVVSEGSVGAGLRRVEARTGEGLLTYLDGQRAILDSIGDLLRCPPGESAGKVAELLERLKNQEKEIERLQTVVASVEADNLATRALEFEGVKVVAARVQATDMAALRRAADAVRDRLGSGVVVLGAVVERRAALVSMATADLVSRGVHAGEVVRVAAREIGGSGGGKPEMGQAGGKNPEMLDASLARAVEVAREQLGRRG